MSNEIIDIIRAVVRDELKSLRLGDIAIVTSAFAHSGDEDGNNYECSVKLRDSELELRKVPMATAHIGMVSAPNVGDLVLVSYVGGDPNRPIIVGRLYSDESNPPLHEVDEWRVESPYQGETSLALDKEGSVVLSAGKNTITIKKDDLIEIKGEADLTLEVKGNVELKCTDCKVDASGNIELGNGGAGVITETSHKCFFTGAPLIGSQSVKAKI
ncbi:phage baseplate assembly protein V [Pseudomonadota bacterium]